MNQPQLLMGVVVNRQPCIDALRRITMKKRRLRSRLMCSPTIRNIRTSLDSLVHTASKTNPQTMIRPSVATHSFHRAERRKTNALDAVLRFLPDKLPEASATLCSVASRQCPLKTAPIAAALMLRRAPLHVGDAVRLHHTAGQLEQDRKGKTSAQLWLAMEFCACGSASGLTRSVRNPKPSPNGKLFFSPFSFLFCGIYFPPLPIRWFPFVMWCGLPFGTNGTVLLTTRRLYDLPETHQRCIATGAKTWLFG